MSSKLSSNLSKELFYKTPNLFSAILSRHTGCEVFLKLENLQPSGSFKNRGMGYLVQSHVQRGVRAFVAASGGNAGIATAYEGRHLGVHVTVVVSKMTAEVARQRILDEEAELIVYGDDFDEAAGFARKLAKERGAVFVSPYDDPLIWEGHSSLVDEIEKPDAILLSVGGGGLMTGVILGLQRRGWGDVPVIAAGTVGADALAQAMRAGRVVRLPRVTSIASSLGVKQVAQKAFDLTREHRVIPQVVTDAEAVLAILRFADDERMLVEPACGASLAILYENKEVIREFKRITLIVCGGKGVSLALLDQWKQLFLPDLC
ncbi:MAG: pyridoxal-phosphate dependent enzyme [Verrucomicrobia bacterium]|nr:pyridoxal-phosphate dependent enzyme [Verrucomicrobiota bacterium]